MLKVVALGGAAVAMLAISAGVVFAVLRAGQPTQGAAVPAPTPGAIGSTGHLRPGGDAILWVDDLGLFAWQRAYENRDDKAEQAAFHLYETLRVPASAPVKVIARRGDAVQVEILEGPYDGRRGWIMGPLAP